MAIMAIPIRILTLSSSLVIFLLVVCSSEVGLRPKSSSKVFSHAFNFSFFLSFKYLGYSGPGVPPQPTLFYLR